MGQSKQAPTCRECGVKGPKGARKAHGIGWGRELDHTWLCPVHAEEARVRRIKAESTRRKERAERRQREGKKLPLNLLLSMAALGSVPRR